MGGRSCYLRSSQGKLEWAGEVVICVPAKGRELVRSLSITLLKEYELVPLRVHTDSVIATTFKLTPSHKKELRIDGYRVVSELMCNVVIIDKLRYVSGGHCHNMCKPRTLNSIKYATKRGIDLVNRI
ncbi:hypothetical protein VPDG_00060 [Vibrio phage henriette 12B8]|uniref:hypothetical protein n=1 Tax=Vibrio phage henriette 12B8 TaxID=573174 RepID=UPI0002C11A00|nr:hypothetical protein VPDG_00060 [Vibrio phage henriette 12B8]AGG58221.1 hypothetical protein VPDG_00060 [Vibrio phage henriette 12B8]